jgi:hypothetical protein
VDSLEFRHAILCAFRLVRQVLNFVFDLRHGNEILFTHLLNRKHVIEDFLFSGSRHSIPPDCASTVEGVRITFIRFEPVTFTGLGQLPSLISLKAEPEKMHPESTPIEWLFPEEKATLQDL